MVLTGRQAAQRVVEAALTALRCIDAVKANAFTGNSDGIAVNHTCLAAHIGLDVGSNEREKENEQRSHAIDHVDHVTMQLIGLYVP